ncbi:MAG: ester cyclase [Porticoccaceae bacterium]
MNKGENLDKHHRTGSDAVRGWIDIINTRDYAKLKDFFDEEAYVTYAAGGFPESHGYDAIAELIEGFHRAISELHCTVEDLLEADDGRVVGRFFTRGIHSGEFMGVKPTGKAVGINGIAIYTFRDGKIIHEWNMDDLLGLLQQVGGWR